jgi:hypothetical protein
MTQAMSKSPTSEDMAATDNTVPKQLTPFKPGQSGNPAGRPKGARNRLGEQFLADLHDTWAEHGVAALTLAAKTEPVQLIKVVANLLPKEIVVASLTQTNVAHHFDIKLDAMEYVSAWRLVEQAKERIGAVIEDKNEPGDDAGRVMDDWPD